VNVDDLTARLADLGVPASVARAVVEQLAGRRLLATVDLSHDQRAAAVQAAVIGSQVGGE
jgi:hypothetical protein